MSDPSAGLHEDRAALPEARVEDRMGHADFTLDTTSLAPAPDAAASDAEPAPEEEG